MKQLKTITITLSIIVISVISFLGIYKKDEYRVRNILPDYKLGMNFTKQRILKMKPDEGIKEKLIYDKDGKLVEKQEEGVEYTEENGYKIEEIKLNDPSVLTEENYKKTSNILSKRLYNLKAGEYKLNLNKETGEITITLQENDKTDLLKLNLNQIGTITLTDSETKELLLDQSHLKDTKLLYGSNIDEKTGENVAYIYLNIMFDKEGTAKLQELSKIYVETTTEITNEKGEKEEKKEEKKLTITLNGEEIGSTVLSNIMYNNNSLALGLGASSDAQELEMQRENAESTRVVLESGALPIIYSVEDEEVEPYKNGETKAETFALIGVIILAIMYVYFILRFDTKGVLLANLLLVHVALTLIILRYANVKITISGMFGILIGAICNFILLLSLAKGKLKFSKVLLKHLLHFTPLYVLVIVLSFMKLDYLNSFGMTMVWSAIMIYLSNLVFAKPISDLFKDSKHPKKKKN